MLLFGPGVTVLLLETASCVPRRLTQPRAVLRRVRRKVAMREVMCEAVCELFEDSSWHTLDALCVALLLAALLVLASKRGARGA